ncbi:hypothetical protein, partial [Aeromonas media]|uniref:hypothetical protein n=1 Tax=Aeromonas media TaxID=651 RepID=UPI003D1D09B2
TEYPWSACQKAPSVTVTWGWGSCGLIVDLGNSATSSTIFMVADGGRELAPSLFSQQEVMKQGDTPC